jgi:pimeloyl-ACP methyl ester carboxylesterase
MPSVQRPDGAEIAYDIAGNGPPVLFVHGLTNDRRSWTPVTALLERDFTCLRVDLRGHGESSLAAEYGMPSLVTDVRAVVEHAGLGEPVVIGHSLGAPVAACYAAAFAPTAVVCVDNPLRVGPFAALLQQHRDALLSPDTMEAVRVIEAILGVDIGDRVHSFPREVVLGIWDAMLTRPPEQLDATMEEVLARIDAPLLSLHGSPPPPGYEAWLTRLVPRAQIELWPGAGHLLHLADPGRFAARVRAFADAGSAKTPGASPSVDSGEAAHTD